MTRDNTTFRGQTVLGKTINTLAARPQGTNVIEIFKVCGQKGNSMLTAWIKKGYIFRSEESTGTMACAFQYFRSQTDLDAWQALPMDRRPNVARKRSNHTGSKPRRAMLKPLNAMQLGTWVRAPLIGSVNAKKTIVRCQGIALGYDTRYELGPEASASFRGEFSKLGPGRYL